MIREKKDSNRNNGRKDDLENKALLNTLIENQKTLTSHIAEINERMLDLETRRSSENKALLQMVNFLYDTDDKHIPELSRISHPAARPFALGMALESILDEDVQSGAVPLSQKVRLNYLRLQRSVGGVHLGRGLRLAEDQAQAAAEEAEERELGE